MSNKDIILKIMNWVYCLDIVTHQNTYLEGFSCISFIRFSSLLSWRHVSDDDKIERQNKGILCFSFKHYLQEANDKSIWITVNMVVWSNTGNHIILDWNISSLKCAFCKQIKKRTRVVIVLCSTKILLKGMKLCLPLLDHLQRKISTLSKVT